MESIISESKRTMETPNEIRMKIVDKAAEDMDFRARLLSDPKGAIEQELGVTIPASLSIEVHEDTEAAEHLVLPPDSRLSEGDLQAVAGGWLGLSSDADDWNPRNW